MAAVAQHCNQTMKRVKQLDKWKTLVARFGQQLPFNPQRTLLLSDRFSIKVNRAGLNKQKLVFLFSDALAYGHDEVFKPGKTVLDHVFRFPHVQTRKGAVPFSVEVLTPLKKVLLLMCTAEQQVR